MWIIDIISCTVLIAVFIYGIGKLFDKERPLYFKLLICAIGCYALGQFSNTVLDFCGLFSSVTAFSTSAFCYFGTAVFLLTANTKGIDGSVCRNTGKKAARIALIAPFVYAAFLLFFVISLLPYDPLSGIVSAIILAPNIVNCYYYLLHLLSAPDEKGILRSIRPVDVLLFLFSFLSILCLIAYWYEFELLGNALEFFVSLLLLALTAASVKGAKSW